jgi:hypothetical protein
MSLLVDTSVWSLAFRRESPPGSPDDSALRAALQGGEQVFISGLVFQDVLQGFAGPKRGLQVPNIESSLWSASLCSPFSSPNSKTTSQQLNSVILAAAEVSRLALLMPCSLNFASAMN